MQALCGATYLSCPPQSAADLRNRATKSSRLEWRVRACESKYHVGCIFAVNSINQSDWKPDREEPSIIASSLHSLFLNHSHSSFIDSAITEAFERNWGPSPKQTRTTLSPDPGRHTTGHAVPRLGVGLCTSLDHFILVLPLVPFITAVVEWVLRVFLARYSLRSGDATAGSL